MTDKSETQSEFKRFDETVRKMISVPREEILRRHEEWAETRKQQKTTGRKKKRNDRRRKAGS